MAKPAWPGSRSALPKAWFRWANCGTIGEGNATPALNASIPRRLRNGPRLKAGDSLWCGTTCGPSPPFVTPEEPRKRRHPGSMKELGTNCGTKSAATATPALNASIPRRLRNGLRLAGFALGRGDGWWCRTLLLSLRLSPLGAPRSGATRLRGRSPTARRRPEGPATSTVRQITARQRPVNASPPPGATTWAGRSGSCAARRGR